MKNAEDRSKSSDADGLMPVDGKSCWVKTVATRAGIYLDGEEYFKSLYENIRKAQRSLIFLGWDFDSRLELVRSDTKEHGSAPLRFGPLLKKLAKERPDLEIYILAWDYATYYLPMRELFQKMKFSFRSGPNVHFTFDGQHPLGASHHQKIVVVDDVLAYCGGFDITSRRWDSSQHLAHDPRRTAPDGGTYAPFHDVAVAVTGETALKLSHLARERLRVVMPRQQFAPPNADDVSEAQFTIKNEITNVQAAIARTMPAYRGRPEVREVEQQFLEQIAAARRYIYIENQYLTAEVVIAALEERLRREDCPPVMIVLPKKQSDPVSKYTMGVLTARAVQRLRDADRFEKLFIGHPEVPGLKRGEYENIHSKVTAIDDELIRIGSANLNNRSMGLDTECDVTLLAGGDERLRKVFRSEVARMIANHFPAEQEEVQKAWQENDLSFRATVKSLEKPGKRTLVSFEELTHESALAAVADLEIVDLDRTAKLEFAGDTLLSRVENETGEFFRKVPVGLLLTILTCVVCALLGREGIWPVTNTNSYPAIMTASVFALAGVSLLPFSVVVVLLATVLGTERILLLLPGVALAILAGYSAGMIFLRASRRLPGRWLPLVDEKLKEAGFWSIFWSRFFPFAPFAVVSLVCGRNRVDLTRYLVASLLGIAPYIFIVAAFQIQLLRFLRTFRLEPLTGAFFLGLLTLIGLRLIQKRFVAPAAEGAK